MASEWFRYNPDNFTFTMNKDAPPDFTFQDTDNTKTNTTTIIIGPEVTVIKDELFKNFKKLRTLDLSKNKLDNIGKRAFCDCKDLETLTFTSCNRNKYIKKIHERAFYNCVKLTSLDLSSLFLLRFIGDEAFCNCKSLKGILDLRNSENLRYIGRKAFSGNELTKVLLYDRFTAIYHNAFARKFKSTVDVSAPLLEFDEAGDGNQPDFRYNANGGYRKNRNNKKSNKKRKTYKKRQTKRKRQTRKRN